MNSALLYFIQTGLIDEEKLEMFKIITEYGCYGEYDSNNSMLKAVFDSLIQPKIDIAQGRYEEKIAAGQAFGRRRKVDDGDVAVLAKQGLKAKEIAAQLDVSVDAIYHSDGWKNRKNL